MSSGPPSAMSQRRRSLPAVQSTRKRHGRLRRQPYRPSSSRNARPRPRPPAATRSTALRRVRDEGVPGADRASTPASDAPRRRPTSSAPRGRAGGAAAPAGSSACPSRRPRRRVRRAAEGGPTVPATPSCRSATAPARPPCSCSLPALEQPRRPDALRVVDREQAALLEMKRWTASSTLVGAAELQPLAQSPGVGVAPVGRHLFAGIRMIGRSESASRSSWCAFVLWSVTARKSSPSSIAWSTISRTVFARQSAACGSAGRRSASAPAPRGRPRRHAASRLRAAPP